MYGRMIHSGKTDDPGQSQNYDVHGRVSLSLFIFRGGKHEY